jgi:gamma-glutamyltranspeptidase/glutathione hydrolase
VGHDRPAVLYDGAAGSALLDPERLAAAADRVDAASMAPPDVASGGGTVGPDVARVGDGDTTHLCALDADGLGVSLTQSNALDFGSHIVEPSTGIFLHNRGVGFSLVPGHPAEVAPGLRPPHTLSPMLVTARNGAPDGAQALTHLVGAMGGDAQPQIIVQLLARLLRAGQDPATAITAPRLTLDAPSAGPFRLWWGEDLTVVVESDAAPAWRDGLTRHGHRVRAIGAFDPVAVGCAQIIAVERDAAGARRLVGASDPRSPAGDAVGR